MIASKTLAAGLIAFGTLVAAAPANAGDVTVEIGSRHWGGHPGYHYEPGYRHGYDRNYRHRGLSAREVHFILRRHGFRDIRILDRRGPVYVARGEDRRGRDYRLVVSARSGALISAQRLRG